MPNSCILTVIRLNVSISVSINILVYIGVGVICQDMVLCSQDFHSLLGILLQLEKNT